ncbi:unnamed protein product, partial [Brassica oleracea]
VTIRFIEGFDHVLAPSSINRNDRNEILPDSSVCSFMVYKLHAINWSNYFHLVLVSIRSFIAGIQSSYTQT